MQGVPITAAAAAAAAAHGAPTVSLAAAPAAPAAAAPAAPPGEQPLGVAIKDLLFKRLRVLVGGAWKEGQVTGYNHG